MQNRKLIKDFCKSLGLEVKKLTFKRISVDVFYDCSVMYGYWELYLLDGRYFESNYQWNNVHEDLRNMFQDILCEWFDNDCRFASAGCKYKGDNICQFNNLKICSDICVKLSARISEIDAANAQTK